MVSKRGSNRVWGGLRHQPASLAREKRKKWLGPATGLARLFLTKPMGKLQQSTKWQSNSDKYGAENLIKELIVREKKYGENNQGKRETWARSCSSLGIK